MQDKLVEQQKSLTCDKDTSILNIKYCKQPNMFKAANPFMDQAPYRILTRQYKIGEFNITPSFAIQEYQFPQALMVIPAIQKALSSFFFFRADLEVSVKLNSTPYHQGLLQSSFIHDVADTGAILTVQQRSALNAVYYNYSSSDSATMQFGWLHPQIYMKLNFPPDPFAYQGILTLQQIVNIANTSGGGTTISCTVYARFLNPRTAGFISQPPMGQSGKSFKFAYQPESEEKSETKMPVSTTTEPFLSPLFKAIPLIEGTISNVVDLFSTLTKGMDKPVQMATPARMQYDIGSDNIAGAGNVLATRLTLYPTSRLATFPLSDGCHDSSMPLVQIAQQPMLYDVYNFTATNTTYTFYAHPMNAGVMGATSSTLCQPDYLAYVTAFNRYWKGSIKYLMYFVTNSFTTARFRISYIINYDENDLDYGGDFPSQLLDIKGSTINKITIPYLWSVPYRNTQPDGVLPTSGYNLTPKIQVELLSLPVASQGSAPFISLVLWRAAGEDYQLASPQATLMNPTNMRPVGQTSMNEEFKFKFPAIACECTMILEQGFCTTETVGRADDILKRFTNSPPDATIYVTRPKTFKTIDVVDTTFQIGPAGADTTHNPQYLSPYWQIIQLFKYQRGSMRYRFLRQPTTEDTKIYTFTPATINSAYDKWSGQDLWVTKHNPVHTIETPWIGTVPYIATDVLEGGPSINFGDIMNVVDFAIDTDDSTVGVFSASGDDRVYSYLLPPPVFSWTETAMTTTTLTTTTTATTSTLATTTVIKRQAPKVDGNSSLKA